MNMLSHGMTLRLLLLGESPALPARAAEALLADDDILGLAALAYGQRVASWVAAALARDPRFADERFAPLRIAATRQTVGTLRLYGEFTRVLAQLNAASVDTIVLKGPALAQSVYSDAGLRPYGDIDILIHEADLARVGAMLEAQGYRDTRQDNSPHRLHECHGIFQRIYHHAEQNYTVEVHTDHLQIGLEPVSMDEIWQRSKTQRFNGAEANVLDTQDLFLQLSVHLHRHGFTRLIWFKDLDLMVRKGMVQWTLLERMAEAQGCLDSVAYTLRLLRRMLRTPLPHAADRITHRQSLPSLGIHRLMWPEKQVLSLEPQRRGRLRRAVQFAPETGAFRGGLPSLLVNGRRMDKLRVLAAGRLSAHWRT